VPRATRAADARPRAPEVRRGHGRARADLALSPATRGWLPTSGGLFPWLWCFSPAIQCSRSVSFYPRLSCAGLRELGGVASRPRVFPTASFRCSRSWLRLWGEWRTVREFSTVPRVPGTKPGGRSGPSPPVPHGARDSEDLAHRHALGRGTQVPSLCHIPYHG
jgi:hypothetical protein